jgi:hypothetical protein
VSWQCISHAAADASSSGLKIWTSCKWHPLLTGEDCIHYFTVRFLGLEFFNMMSWRHIATFWIALSVVHSGECGFYHLPLSRQAFLLDLPLYEKQHVCSRQVRHAVFIIVVESCTNTDMLNWFCSDLGAVTLLALHACCCHATSNVGDIWRGAESFGCSCESGFGEFQKTQFWLTYFK